MSYNRPAKYLIGQLVNLLAQVNTLTNNAHPPNPLDLSVQALLLPLIGLASRL